MKLLQSLNLSADTLKAIFWQNAERLLPSAEITPHDTV